MYLLKEDSFRHGTRPELFDANMGESNLSGFYIWNTRCRYPNRLASIRRRRHWHVDIGNIACVILALTKDSPSKSSATAAAALDFGSCGISSVPGPSAVLALLYQPMFQVLESMAPAGLLLVRTVLPFDGLSFKRCSRC